MNKCSNRKIISLFLVLTLAGSLLTGCSTRNESQYSASTPIQLSDGGSSCESANVDIDNNIITIKAAGEYVLSGSLSRGYLVVDAQDEEVILALNNVSISSESFAAIYVKKAKKVTISALEGTENNLQTSGEYEEIDKNNVDAVIFSKADLQFEGSGKINVNGEYGHGIVSKDKLVFDSGSFVINAEKKGISGKDSLEVKGGDIKIACGKKGLHSESELLIRDGKVAIIDSYEGFEAPIITVEGGDIYINAADDGMNASSDNGETMNPFAAEEGLAININGGKVVISAQGDGIDSNGALYVRGGEIVVHGPTNGGNGALDFSGEAIIEGGRVIAMGSSGMAENFGNSSTQGSILFNADTNYPAGTAVKLLNSEGVTLLEAVSEKSFNSVVFSCEDIKVGSDYVVKIGDDENEITMTEIIYGQGSGFGRGFGNFDGRGDRKEREDFNPEDMPEDFNPEDFRPEDMPGDFGPGNFDKGNGPDEQDGGKRPGGMRPDQETREKNNSL